MKSQPENQSNELDYLEALNMDNGSVEEETSTLPKHVKKFNQTVTFIEDELYTTLNYLNNQLDLIDDQTGDTKESGEPVPFNRNVYEAKKNIVEQKLSTLRALASISGEVLKVSSKNKDDGSVSDINALFAD